MASPGDRTLHSLQQAGSSAVFQDTLDFNFEGLFGADTGGGDAGAKVRGRYLKRLIALGNENAYMFSRLLVSGQLCGRLSQLIDIISAERDGDVLCLCLLLLCLIYFDEMGNIRVNSPEKAILPLLTVSTKCRALTQHRLDDLPGSPSMGISAMEAIAAEKIPYPDEKETQIISSFRKKRKVKSRSTSKTSSKEAVCIGDTRQCFVSYPSHATLSFMSKHCPRLYRISECASEGSIISGLSLALANRILQGMASAASSVRRLAPDGKVSNPDASPLPTYTSGQDRYPQLSQLRYIQNELSVQGHLASVCSRIAALNAGGEVEGNRNRINCGSLWLSLGFVESSCYGDLSNQVYAI